MTIDYKTQVSRLKHALDFSLNLKLLNLFVLCLNTKKTCSITYFLSLKHRFLSLILAA